MGTFPGSLSEGAVSPNGLTEGVSFNGCSEPMVIRKPFLALKFLSVYVHRSTLPQSRFARQLPQRGSREGLHHSTRYSLNSGVAGDFHRPYGGRVPFIGVLTEIRGYGRFSSPRKGGCHAPDCLETATLRHLNCGTEKTFAFFVHLCYNT